MVPKLPEKRVFRMRYGPGAAGGYKLKITSNDMGALLRALDLRDTVLGGQLEIVGGSDGPIPKHTLSASIEAKDYALVNATTLTKILTAGSLTGLIDTLSGDFLGSTGLFGVILDRHYDDTALGAMLDHMELFAMGASWGG